MNRPSTASMLVVLAGVVVGVIVQNAIPIGVFHDDGQYLILARSIAEHGTYRFDNLPGAPPGLHYPPGFPAFLALVWLVAPGNVQAFKLANAVLLGVAALSIYGFSRRVFALERVPAAAVAVVIILSAPFIWLNSLLVSETLFVAALYGVLALAFAQRDASPRWQTAIGAAAGGVALIRSLADPLGILFALERAWRRRWRDAALIAGGWIVVVAPWKLWLHAHAQGVPQPLVGAYGEYGAWWRAAVDAHGAAFVWATAKENLAQLPLMLAVLGWGSVPVLQWLCAAMVAALAAYGAWRARDAAAVALAYAVLYVAIVLVWPFEPDRFLWMLAPVAAAAVAATAVTLTRVARDAGGARRWVFGAAGLVVLAGLAATTSNALRTRPWERGLGERGDKGKAAARLASALPPAARIATDFDEIVHLQTGRTAVPALGLTASEYVYPRSAAEMAARLDSVVTTFGITHVIVADVPTLDAMKWLIAHGRPFAPIASDSGGAVLFARAATPRAPDSTDAGFTPSIRR